MFWLLWRVALEAGSGGSGPAPTLPANIIVATVAVHNVARTMVATETVRSITSGQPLRSVTFDG